MQESSEKTPLINSKYKPIVNEDEITLIEIQNETKPLNNDSDIILKEAPLDEVELNTHTNTPAKIEETAINFQDPFLQQLPKEILKYIQTPTNKTIPFIKRTTEEKVGRNILGTLLFPYTALKSQLVREGEICLTWNGDKPEILGPGRHVLFKPTNTVAAIKSINEPIIQHGSLSIIRVAVGQLAFALDGDTGKPALLSPGLHVINSATFKFQKFLDLSQPLNDLGFIKLVRVDTGKIGKCFLHNGALKILEPGFHLITPPDSFGGFDSTQLQILTLPEGEFESSDYVTLVINADVFYKIVDAKKVFTNVQDIKKSVSDVAVATLSNIIRSSTLADIGQSSKPSYKKNMSEVKPLKTENDFTPSAPSFYKRVHDEFITELHDHYLEDWGVSIENIRIESLKIKDAKFAKDISEQAVSYAKVQTELSNSQYQNQIQAATSEREANSLRIKSESEALAIERGAGAKSRAAIIEAQGKAEAIKMIAAAKYEAAKLEADGRAYYARKMKEVGPVGEKLALYDAQTTAFGQVQKMVYLPQSALPSFFNSFNNQLSSLELDENEKKDELKVTAANSTLSTN